MRDPIKRALARKRVSRGRVTVEEPNPKLVLVVKFAVCMTICFSGWSWYIFCCLEAGTAKSLRQSQV